MKALVTVFDDISLSHKTGFVVRKKSGYDFAIIIFEVISLIDLEKKFHNDMVQIYLTAKSLKYNANYFMQMISEKGGYLTAKQLIHTSTPSEGFTRLWEFKRLDLSVEAHVLKPEYYPLFSDDERQVCKDRLSEYGYQVQSDE